MIFVVASMTNRTMPVNVFRMKPAHMYGYIFRTSAKGTSRAQPKIRKAIRPLIPATTPIPSVWRKRTPGYASREFDSRTHTEKPLCSIADKNCIIRKNALFHERRHYTGIEDPAKCQNALSISLVGMGRARLEFFVKPVHFWLMNSQDKGG